MCVGAFMCVRLGMCGAEEEGQRRKTSSRRTLTLQVCVRRLTVVTAALIFTVATLGDSAAVVEFVLTPVLQEKCLR
eukprot:1639677-Rhodomonas_salina.11